VTPLRTNPSGSVKWVRLFSRDQTAGAPLRGRNRLRRKVQGRRGGSERIYRPGERSKALKGEAQERWGLKEVPQVPRRESRREGSQTLRAVPLPIKATVGGRFAVRKREKAPLGPDML
jgi:hypothetical protein